MYFKIKIWCSSNVPSKFECLLIHSKLKILKNPLLTNGNKHFAPFIKIFIEFEDKFKIQYLIFFNYLLNLSEILRTMKKVFLLSIVKMGQYLVLKFIGTFQIHHN